MVRAGLMAMALLAAAAAGAAEARAAQARTAQAQTQTAHPQTSQSPGAQAQAGTQKQALAEPAATAESPTEAQPADPKPAARAGRSAHERHHGRETPPSATLSRAELDALIARHAQENGVPEPLVRRVIVRESRYDAGLVGKGGAMGLMQIKHGTAQALGYDGTARGLLDPETNLTYAVRYLAGAYRAADGNADRAVSLYAHGYYEAAKRKHLKAERTAARLMPEQPDSADAIY